MEGSPLSDLPENIRKELRKKKKLRQPRFRRFESWRYKRVKAAWRRPRGIDNRMLEKKRGYPPLVSVGYRTPRTLRHFHPSGHQEVLIHNMNDLELVNPRTQAARISKTVGRRKRTEIISQAEVYGIRVLNPTYGGIQLEETIGEGLSPELEGEEGLSDLSVEDLARYEDSEEDLDEEEE